MKRRCNVNKHDNIDYNDYSFYCPYCGHTNTISKPVQEKFKAEHKLFMCGYCKRGFDLNTTKTVTQLIQIEQLKKAHMQFLKRKEQEEKSS